MDTQPTPSAPQLPGWHSAHTLTVRFRDIDMFNHVNNAVYLTYAEIARVGYYNKLTGITDPRDFDMTVARAEVNYIVPIFFGQTIHIYTRTSRIGNKSLTMEHELRDATSNALLSTVSTVLVHFNHQTGISTPLPPEVVVLIETHEGRPLREPPPNTGN